MGAFNLSDRHDDMAIDMDMEMDEEMVPVLPELPDCLIFDIFSRLPVKSLCRFKCVSKFYLSFIEDPYFVNQVRPKTPMLLQIQSAKEHRIYSIDCDGSSTLKHTHYCEPENDFRGLQFCNGLNVCFSNGVLFVYNYTTSEFARLPSRCNKGALCFDPTLKKFKVLGWVGGESEPMPLDLYVLTLERDPSWRPVKNTLGLKSMREPDAVVNGEPFWLFARRRQIISFHPATEQFREIELPVEAGLEHYKYCIFEFEGSLSLIEHYLGKQAVFNLWMLNGSVWVTVKKNVTIPFQGTNLSQGHSIPWIASWLSNGFNFSSRGGELLVTVVGETDYQFIFIYNFLNNQFRTIKATGLPFHYFTMLNNHMYGYMLRNYVENYVSIHELLCHH